MMRGGHQRDLLALRLVALRPLEVRPHGRGATPRLPGSLGDQLADHWRALPCEMPEAVAVAGLVLARDEPEVAPDV
jgi:hypothetical protein